MKEYQESSDSIRETFDDEADRKKEIKRLKEQAECREFEETKAKMLQDVSLREDMRRQDELRTQLRLAHKQGDTATVKRLERLLAPDEPRQQRHNENML